MVAQQTKIRNLFDSIILISHILRLFLNPLLTQAFGVYLTFFHRFFTRATHDDIGLTRGMAQHAGETSLASLGDINTNLLQGALIPVNERIVVT